MSGDQQFEAEMSNLLTKQLGDSFGQAYAATYVSAKHKLIHEIYGHIQGAEPNLSDHGRDHIANVLTNAHELLGGSLVESGLDGIEAYCLGMVILFHDVGNLFGRENHRNKISEVFDWVRGTDARIRAEKTLVLRAAWSHTGTASDGTADTLKELSNNEQLERKRVRLQLLASVLRFADELAEGPQRTSEFMRIRHGYAPDSQLFHDYASITNVHIDRGGGRIALKYEIDVPTGGTTRQRQTAIKKLLSFTYKRIEKLDQERRYARYYSPLLSPFVATEATFNFHYNGAVLEPFLPHLQLTDKTIPGDPQRSLDQIWPVYAVADVVATLWKQCV